MREISIIKIQFGVQIAEEKVYVYMKNAYKLNLYEDYMQTKKTSNMLTSIQIQSFSIVVFIY